MIANDFTVSGDTADPTPTARALWRGVTLLAALQGLLAVFLILQTRSAESGRILGLSSLRLGLLALVALFSLFFAWLGAETWLRPAAFAARWKRLAAWLDRRRTWNIALLACAGLLFLSLAWVGVLPDLDDTFTQAIFLRLQPLAVWAAGISFLGLIGLLVLRHGPDGLLDLRPRQPVFYLLLALFALSLLAWGWAARAVLPVEGQRLGWNRLGAPLIETQVFLAWLLGLGLFGLLAWMRAGSTWARRLRPRGFDLLLGLLIWLAAVIAWQSVPLQSNWFVSSPTHPNFEYYPSSDARAYDASSQTALIGLGYRFYNAPYVRRSLLAMYLTVLHWVGGQQYERVILLQIMVLALLPVGVYLLTRALHNRAAGGMAAALVILREANSIGLAGDITTSNVKLLMADLPATLMTVIFILLVIVWLQHIERRPLLALAAGGALGFSMLVRLETVVLAAPAALAAGLILWPRRQLKLWLQSGLLAALGVLLVLAPWVTRNYSLTGEIFIDHPYFSLGLLIQRFNPAAQMQPGEPGEGGEFTLVTPTANAAPALVLTPTPPPAKVNPLFAPAPAQAGAPQEPAPTPTPGIAVEVLQRETDKAVDYIFQNPARILSAVAGHILNSQMQTFLVLPSAGRGLDSAVALAAHRSGADYWAACCTVRGYVRRMPYWRQWNDAIPTQAILPLALNLLLIAAGVTQAWKRQRWVGLTPLLFWAMYITFNGMFRNSGGRYLLPVDWVGLVYFSIGLAAVTRGLFAYLGGPALPETLPDEGTSLAGANAPASRAGLLGAPRFYGLAVGLFLLACAVPLVEAIQPLRYPQARQQEMLQALLAAEQIAPEQRAALQTFLSNGAVSLAGRALYPRYFAPNQGDDVSKRNPLSPRPYPRLVFYLAAANSMNMMLPLADKPLSFPNAADVLVIACPERDVLAVARFSSSGSLKMVYLRDPFPAVLTCPLPPEVIEKKKP